MIHPFNIMIDRYGTECTLIFVRITTFLLVVLMFGLVVMNFFYTDHKIDKGVEIITEALHSAGVIKN